MRAMRGLWRWRGNPLRRTTDLVEAWAALAALVLILVAAPLIGAAVGATAQDALQRTVREQRHARHEVVATVVRRLDHHRLDPDPETATARDARSHVLANWRGPDGTARHGAVLTGLEQPRPGKHFTVWTDAHGRPVPRPLDSVTATTHAVLAGFGSTAAVAGLVEGGRRLLVWRLVRRRYARLDRAWEKAGPDWGRTGTGA
ncbi:MULTISPECIES: Rv1733c family protein [Streptomyces]|uniref:Rv1733c family protein n=1 Tax=Streptomyces TaxID=1883 RepID=UPI0038147AD6